MCSVDSVIFSPDFRSEIFPSRGNWELFDQPPVLLFRLIHAVMASPLSPPLQSEESNTAAGGRLPKPHETQCVRPAARRCSEVPEPPAQRLRVRHRRASAGDLGEGQRWPWDLETGHRLSQQGPRSRV